MDPHENPRRGPTPGNRRRRAVLFGLQVLGIAVTVHGSAVAQSKEMTLTGPTGASAGAPFALAGDLDGDAVPDYLVADVSSKQIVLVFSGVDGGLLHTFTAPQFFSEFGSALAGGRDIDGDAVPDILIGASWNSAPGIDSGSL